MWVFVFIPGVLCILTGIVEGIQYLVRRYREEHPYIGHLNCRNTGYGS